MFIIFFGSKLAAAGGKSTHWLWLIKHVFTKLIISQVYDKASNHQLRIIINFTLYSKNTIGLFLYINKTYYGPSFTMSMNSNYYYYFIDDI